MLKIKPKAYVSLPGLSCINPIWIDGVIRIILWQSQFDEHHLIAKHTFLILPRPRESEYLTAFTLFSIKRAFGAHVCQQLIKTGFHKCRKRWSLTTLQSCDWADRSLCTAYQEMTPPSHSSQLDSHQQGFQCLHWWQSCILWSVSAVKALSGGGPRLAHCSVDLLVQLCHLFSLWPRPFSAFRTRIAELESRGGRSDKFCRIGENFPCETQRFPLPAHWSLGEIRGKKKNPFVWVIHTILRKAFGTVLQGVALHWDKGVLGWSQVPSFYSTCHCQNTAVHFQASWWFGLGGVCVQKLQLLPVFQKGNWYNALL